MRIRNCEEQKVCVKPEPMENSEWIKLPVPVPGDDEVLIKVLATSICGTDLHIYRWDSWAERTIKPPMVIGHEFVGEIVELGASVHGLKVGELVDGEGHIVCGVCRNCRAGTRHATPSARQRQNEQPIAARNRQQPVVRHAIARTAAAPDERTVGPRAGTITPSARASWGRWVHHKSRRTATWRPR